MTLPPLPEPDVSWVDGKDQYGYDEYSHAHSDAATLNYADQAVAAEREHWQAATALCDKHQPSGGARGYCVICAGEALSAALSKISYLCSEPNEMEVGPYDVHYDENAVVAQVQTLASVRARMLGAIKRAEVEHTARAGREIYSLHIDQHMHTAEAMRALHAELSLG